MPASCFDQIEALEELGHPGRPVGAAEVMEVGHQPQVLLTGQELVHRGELASHADHPADVVGLPNHVESCDVDVAGVSGDQGGQDPHDGRLTCTVRAEQREYLSLADIEVDTVEDSCLTERMADTRGRYGGDTSVGHRNSPRIG